MFSHQSWNCGKMADNGKMTRMQSSREGYILTVMEFDHCNNNQCQSGYRRSFVHMISNIPIIDAPHRERLL